MKNLLNLLCAGVLGGILCVGFVACNDPGGQKQKINENEVRHAQVSDEIADFFNDTGTLYVLGKSIDFGFDPYANFDIDGTIRFTPEELPFVGGCVMINSANELPQTGYDGTPFEFPAIDFDSHTLVIGVYMDTGGDHVVSQSLVVEQGTATMNITLGKRSGDDFYVAMTIPAYFWGMYPKVEAESIQTNVVNPNVPY